jgi:KDO2-lipid IV(A) lauroyltransferase
VVAVFQHGALNYWDTFDIPHVTHAQLLRLGTVHGVEHIANASAGGHGVVMVSAHLGSVAFVGQVLPALGYPASGLLEPLDPPELYDYIAAKRRALGVNLLPLGPSALREMLLALRRNEVLALVADRDVTGTGPIVPFFDAPTHFPDGPAALAVRTGAPILSAMCARLRDGRFEAWVEPLDSVPLTGDTRADVLALTRAVARRLQYHVASHPEQWTVFQRRWPRAQPG